MEKVTVNKESGTVTIDGVTYKIGEVVKQKPTPEERFLELVKGSVRIFDFQKHPETDCFWKKDGEVIIEEKKNGHVCIDYDKIWKVFRDEYGYNREQVSELCKKVLEEHFNLRVCTILPVLSVNMNNWRNISI